MGSVGDGRAGEAGGEMVEERLEAIVDVGGSGEFGGLLGRGGASTEVVEGDVGPLDGDGEGNDEKGEELAGAAGGKPAIDPGEDHADEEHVGEGEGERCGEGDDGE